MYHRNRYISTIKINKNKYICLWDIYGVKWTDFRIHYKYIFQVFMYIHTNIIIHNLQCVQLIKNFQMHNYNKRQLYQMKPFINVLSDPSSRILWGWYNAPYTNLQLSPMLAHIRVKTDPSQTEAKHDKQILRMDDCKGVLTLLN